MMPEIACPAGERIAETKFGRACRCRIEHSTIVDPSRRDVHSSLRVLCEGDYTACTSWRADKRRRTAAPLVDLDEERAGGSGGDLDERLGAAADVRL